MHFQLVCCCLEKITLLIWLFENACVSSHQFSARLRSWSCYSWSIWRISPPSGWDLLDQIFSSQSQLPAVILCVTVSVWHARRKSPTLSTYSTRNTLPNTNKGVLPLSSFVGSMSFLFLAEYSSLCRGSHSFDILQFSLVTPVNGLTLSV